MTYTKEREDFFKPPSSEHRAQMEMPKVIGFKRLSEDATIPTKAFETDSGFDICASADVIIEPGATVIVPTDIALDLPAGYEAIIRPRSGVTAKTKLRVNIGTIDQGFTGNIGIIVDNIAPHTTHERKLSHAVKTISAGAEWVPSYEKHDVNAIAVLKGDRIAQLVIQRLPDVIGVEVSDVGESERGAGGFGSTGV